MNMSTNEICTVSNNAERGKKKEKKRRENKKRTLVAKLSTREPHIVWKLTFILSVTFS